MKILISLAFIASCVVYLYVSIKLIAYAVSSIKKKSLNFLLAFFVGLAITLIFFIQYWLLVGIFPVRSLLLLLSASIVAQIIYGISGSALGITIEETKNKINVLGVVRGFEFGLKNPWINKANSILGLMIFAGWVIALVIYWRTSTPVPSTLFWVSFYIFIIPQLIGTIIMNEYSIPILLSAEYDNDMRNQYFINRFNDVLTTTIFIMLPVSLFYSYHTDISALPPYWLVLLAPLLLFVFLTLIPFLIGANKFYHQQMYNLNWIIDWLKSVNNASIMPDENSKKKTLQEKLTELDAAIEEHINEHEVLKFIDDSNSEEAQMAAAADKNVKAITDIFNTNNANIHKWDVRANYLKELQDLKENIHTDNIENCKVFITTNLTDLEKERDNLSKTKSRIAGIIITVVTAAIGFAFKNYQDDILKILGRLV